jgi:hypothetical protein
VILYEVEVKNGQVVSRKLLPNQFVSDPSILKHLLSGATASALTGIGAAALLEPDNVNVKVSGSSSTSTSTSHGSTANASATANPGPAPGN